MEKFYGKLEDVVKRVKKGFVTVIMGDFNGYQVIVGPYTLETRND